MGSRGGSDDVDRVEMDEGVGRGVLAPGISSFCVKKLERRGEGARAWRDDEGASSSDSDEGKSGPHVEGLPIEPKSSFFAGLPGPWRISVKRAGEARRRRKGLFTVFSGEKIPSPKRIRRFVGLKGVGVGE